LRKRSVLDDCGRLAVIAEPLEEFVAEAALYRRDRVELLSATERAADESECSAAAELQVAETHLEELAKASGEQKS
jgi:hypothetical protein